MIGVGTSMNEVRVPAGAKYFSLVHSVQPDSYDQLSNKHREVGDFPLGKVGRASSPHLTSSYGRDWEYQELYLHSPYVLNGVEQSKILLLLLQIFIPSDYKSFLTKQCESL